MLDPTTVLDTYRSSCQAKTHWITRFVAGREGFDLSRNEAEHLDDMEGVILEQVEAMEDLRDDIIEISKKRTRHIQDSVLSEVRSFYGRIRDFIVCFRDLLTFRFFFKYDSSLELL